MSFQEGCRLVVGLNCGDEAATKPLLSVISLYVRSYLLIGRASGFRGSGVTNWTAIRRRSPILSILQTRAIRLKLAASKDMSESNRGTLKRQIKALPRRGQSSGVEHRKAAPVEETSTIRPREGVSSTLCEKCTGQRYRSL